MEHTRGGQVGQVGGSGTKFVPEKGRHIAGQAHGPRPAQEGLVKVLSTSILGRHIVSLLLDGNPTRMNVESRSVRLGTGVAILLRQSA